MRHISFTWNGCAARRGYFLHDLRGTITVEIEVRDARTGAVIKTRRITQKGQFVPGFGQDVDDARREAYTFLARDIVRELEKEF